MEIISIDILDSNNNNNKEISKEVSKEVSKEKEECIICYNKYDIMDGIIFDCNHKMCIICYESMINNELNLICPICRRSIEVKKDVQISIMQVNEVNEVNERRTYLICYNYRFFGAILGILIIVLLIIQNILYNITKN